MASTIQNNIINKWPYTKPRRYSVACVLSGNEKKRTDAERLNRWKERWRLFQGAEPVENYKVAFCRTCHKPHWIIGAKHKHLVAYCLGH